MTPPAVPPGHAPDHQPGRPPGQTPDHHSHHSHTGSEGDFESDWDEALRTGHPRWLVYPDWQAPEQVALVEAVKAEQVLAVLHAAGHRSGRVLEYGCGAAGMTIWLRRRGYTGVALDRSLVALEVAARNQRLRDPDGAPLIRVAGDARALPFRTGSFQASMSYGLLEHFDGPALSDVLREAVRVLQTRGVFVADIVPGRLNVRSLGIALSFAGSALAHVLRGQARRLPQLWRAYFDHYFESAYGPEAWRDLLADVQLEAVQVRVCRPFPPLALSGAAERAYVSVMRLCLPLWRRFDTLPAALTGRWGWMYLVSGLKERDRRGAVAAQ